MLLPLISLLHTVSGVGSKFLVAVLKSTKSPADGDNVTIMCCMLYAMPTMVRWVVIQFKLECSEFKNKPTILVRRYGHVGSQCPEFFYIAR